MIGLLTALLLAAPVAPACANDGDARLAEIGGAVRDAARFGAPASAVVALSPEMCDRPGRHVPDGAVPAPVDLALDAYCAELIVSRAAPNGMITIFGSARLNAGTPEYENARRFARLWTEKHPELPIVTGGGPGIMEAGNRGAKEAGGVSIGFSTYFGAQGVERPNEYTTDGYMFADFGVRERALVKYSPGTVVYPGGFGTAWELFQVLSEMRTGKIQPGPIVLVGRTFWEPTVAAVKGMLARGTISADDPAMFVVVDTPEEAVTALERGLARPGS